MSRVLSRLRAAIFTRKSAAYREAFATGAGLCVLADLAKFTNKGKTPFHKDPLEMARRAGMQEVFLRIQQSADMTDQQVSEAVRQEVSDVVRQENLYNE